MLNFSPSAALLVARVISVLSETMTQEVTSEPSRRRRSNKSRVPFLKCQTRRKNPPRVV